MKANQLATLVLRLMGVYCILQTIFMVPMFITPWSVAYKDEALSMVSGIVFMLAAPLFVGILLIVFSVKWGEKLAPQNTSEEKTPTISFEQVQALAFAVVGILIFADTLPQLAVSIYELLRALFVNPPSLDHYQYPDLANPFTKIRAVGTLLRAALGLWLFFGANGFANFWRSLRSSGTPKLPQSP